MIKISVLEIDLNEIKKNIKVIKSKLNKNQKLCLVAKANAYGLGDKKICKTLCEDVDYFAVSSSEEFLRLSKFINKPIFILDPIYKNITKCAKLNAVFCVSNLESLDEIIKIAKKNHKIKFNIQIAVNTGMNRFGFSDKKTILFVINKIKKVQNINILSVFSHYFDANDEKSAKKQHKEFCVIKQIFENNYKKNKLLFGLSNSSALHVINDFDIARVGIDAYIDDKFSTIKLKSKIIDFQFLKKGDNAGYSREFIAKKDTIVAIVAIGYADGLFRNITKKGYVLINNKFCKIVAICMDSILVDVTGVQCKICDDVVLVGKNFNNQIFVCDFANWCDTISYEILTHISKRVKRVYKGS